MKNTVERKNSRKGKRSKIEMRNILTTTFKFCQNIEIDFNQQFKTQHNFNKWFTNQGFLAFKNQPIESPLDS